MVNKHAERYKIKMSINMQFAVALSSSFPANDLHSVSLYLPLGVRAKSVMLVLVCILDEALAEPDPTCFAEPCSVIQEQQKKNSGSMARVAI